VTIARAIILLVTFHGGKSGVNNIYGYSTNDKSSKPQTKPETQTALSVPKGVKLDDCVGWPLTAAISSW
jgi:hypothetical protein